MMQQGWRSILLFSVLMAVAGLAVAKTNTQLNECTTAQNTAKTAKAKAGKHT